MRTGISFYNYDVYVIWCVPAQPAMLYNTF
jgi:hypothetical protein